MGTKTQTSTSQQTPVNQAALNNIYGTVANAASTPYTPYSGQLVAGINGQQTKGINTINAGANAAQPYYAQAGQLASGASNPLTAAQIQQYQNPYTQDVVNATQAQFNDQNGQQQNSLKGTAAQQGALGGDRQAVAQAQLAGQQNLSQAPVIAGLYANSYNSGLQAAAQQYQQNPLAAAASLGNIGTGAENAALAGGNAQINAGTLQQQTQQALDTANYGQYQAAQAYPYQSAAYLEQYGLPAALGQGTNGTQTTPGPSVLGQIAGLGIAGAGVATKFAADGGSISYASGGAPGYINSKLGYIDNPSGYIPVVRPSANGQTPAVRPSGPTSLGHVSFLAPQQANMQPTASAISGLPSMKGPAYGGGSALSGDAYGGSSSNPIPGLVGGTGADSDYGPGFGIGGLVHAIHSIHKTIKRSRGGAVSGSMPFAAFDDGGTVPDDPFGADNRAAGYDLLRQGMGTTAPASIPGGEPAPTRGLAPDVINPDSPYRMPDAGAVQAWRDGADHPNPAMVADSGMPDASGTGRNPMLNPASLPRAITNPDNEQPSSALAYDSTGQPTPLSPQAAPSESASTSPFHISDKGSNALIAAGLGMLASRSPFAGVALGEGGLQGLKTYDTETKAEQEAQDKAVTQKQNQQRIDQEAERIHQSIKDSQRAAASGSLVPGPNGKLVPNEALLDYQKKLAEINTKDSFTPIGSVISSDGTTHPLVMNKSDGKIIDSVTQKPPTSSDKIQTGKNDPGVVDHIAHGIESGEQPPTLSGLYGKSGDVRSKLDEHGFDLSKAQVEWKRAEKQVATLNGPQMTRFVGLAKSVDSTIDEVRNLSKQMDNSGIPKLNAAKLALYMQAEGNSENGQLAARYIGAVNTLKEEFANLANGGYAPTEPAWELANKQINGDYGVKQLGASLDEVQRLVRYRVNAIPGLSTMGAGAANRYTGQTAEPIGAAPTGAPAAPPPPANGLVEGRTGTDAQGRRVIVKNGQVVPL